MNEILVVSMMVAACVLAVNAGVKEGKNGFYLTGRAGTSVVSLSDQCLLSGDEEGTSEYKGDDDHDAVFSGDIVAGYDLYPQFNIPVRTELGFYAREKADSKYNIDRDSWSGGYWRDDLENEALINTLVPNAYYDLRDDSIFIPQVSAGTDYARIHRKTIDISTWDYEYGGSGRESLPRSGSADSFTWSPGAGVRYDVTPDIALNPSYHYLGADDSSVSCKDEWGDKYKSEIDIRNHDIMLGTTYNF